MRQAKRLYLPFSQWPERDRMHWAAAFNPETNPFDDDRGLGAHLAERTRQQLQYAYAKFLAFISARRKRLLARPPAERVDRKIIRDYVKWQPKTCGGVTLANYLFHLWYALKYICPDKCWSWLLIISKRLAAQAKRKPKKHHLVTSDTLYVLGCQLMDRVLTSGRPLSMRTMQTTYRDGLIIALGSLVPLLRRRTLAALRIGTHLVRVGNQWGLDLPGDIIKTKRSFEAEISQELSERIDIYLNEIRSRIPGADAHDHLWLSSRGPMSDKMIYKTVRRRTMKALGIPVNLHRFRHAAPTLISIRDPTNIEVSKDLLGHASFRTTQNHYIMAHSRIAGRALAQLINAVMNEEDFS
jgi:integrase